MGEKEDLKELGGLRCVEGERLEMAAGKSISYLREPFWGLLET